MQIVWACPTGSAPSADGTCVAVSSSATATSDAPRSAQAQPKRAPRPTAAAPIPDASYGSLKDGQVEPLSLQSPYGTWAEGYGDYARRTNLFPGNQSVSFTSYGVLSGLDHTYLRSPGEGIMLGGFAGYNEMKGEFSGSATTEAKSQDVQGTMLGLYTTYFRGGFAIDLVAKSDLFNLDQVGLNSDCGRPGTGSVGFVNYVVASNAYYRRDLGNQIWFEPMMGLRVVQTNFAGGAGALGFKDGNSLRLEGGARIGSDWVSADHRLWSLSFFAAIYSDVTVNGYTSPGTVMSGNPTDVLDQDAGALRVLGQLRAKVTTVDGFSYYGQAEVRGGENYLGVGGKIGLRYEW
jgi:hypothetical protein